MHMADALLTPAVAGVMYAASAVVAGASIVELHKEEKQDLTSAAKKLPTMAVMSALVFAGQMINYTIPGTGSSGHLCGGLLLTSVLGPWAGFLSMIVILTIQCLFFADGGLSLLASGNPDGLEWSLFGNSDAGYTQNMGLDEDSYGVQSSAADKAGIVQEKTAFLPDYSFAGSDSAAGTSVSGIAGAAIVAAAAALICGVGGICRHKKSHQQ